SLHKWARKSSDYVMLKGEAKSLFHQWVASIEKGEEKPKAKTNQLTLNAVAEVYLKDYVHHPDRRDGAAKEMARQVEVLQEVFGKLPMADITKPMIEQWRLERRQAHEAGKAAIERLMVLREARAAEARKPEADRTPVEISDELLTQAQRAMISTK